MRSHHTLFGWLAAVFVSVGLPQAPGQSAVPSSEPAARADGGGPAGPAAAERGSAYGAIAGRVRDPVTGRYLPSVRVAVRGTTLETVSDQAGAFVFPRVPAGTRILQLFYTGYATKEVALEVAPGETAEREFALTLLGVTAGGAEETVKLDPYEVSASKETEGKELAASVQRYAPNLTTVVSTDTYGDIANGNPGEFLKYLPGVLATYDNADVQSIGLRGLNASMTNIMVNGAQLANTMQQGTSRQFIFAAASIDNIASVEITLEPTPSMPADTLGGTVNMISKSAFDRKGEEFDYNVNLNANTRELSLTPQPYPRDDRVYKTRPGFSFEYSDPISDKLGLVVTGLESSQYGGYAALTPLWFSATAAAPGATQANPLLQDVEIVTGPYIKSRYSLGGQLDWKPAPHSLLSLNLQTVYFHDDNTDAIADFTVGTNGTPSVAGGVPLSYSGTAVTGATGRGNVTQQGNYEILNSVTNNGSLNYKFDDGTWKVTGLFDVSSARSWYDVMNDGFFRSVTAGLKVPAQVVFTGIRNGLPAEVAVYDSSGAPIDVDNIANYNVTGANQTKMADVHDFILTGGFDLERQLTMLPFPASLRIGVRERAETRDIRITETMLTYNGINGDLSATPYKSPTFDNNVPGNFGFNNYPWLSMYAPFNAWQQNPGLFTITPAQMTTDANFAIANSKTITEKVPAAYVQWESKFFANRLRVVTGVRFEKTIDAGAGPLTLPGGVNLERATIVRRAYDGYYPDLDLTYVFTDDFVVKAEYARTYGRPDFTSILPGATISQPTTGPGTITVSNPGLMPWTANSYDLRAEYYSPSGGVATLGAFRKDISNFFGSVQEVATAANLAPLGLDPSYAGYTIATSLNSGNATVEGAEVNVRQSLAPLFAWGRHVELLGNLTKLRLEGNQTANFTNFVPTLANWGFSVTTSRVAFSALWNYNALAKGAALAVTQYGANAYTYEGARTQLDLDLSCHVTRRVSIYADLRNATNAPFITEKFGPQTPDYAKISLYYRVGPTLTAGIKGTF